MSSWQTVTIQSASASVVVLKVREIADDGAAIHQLFRAKKVDEQLAKTFAGFLLRDFSGGSKGFAQNSFCRGVQQSAASEYLVHDLLLQSVMAASIVDVGNSVTHSVPLCEAEITITAASPDLFADFQGRAGSRYDTAATPHVRWKKTDFGGTCDELTGPPLAMTRSEVQRIAKTFLRVLEANHIDLATLKEHKRSDAYFDPMTGDAHQGFELIRVSSGSHAMAHLTRNYESAHGPTIETLIQVTLSKKTPLLSIVSEESQKDFKQAREVAGFGAMQTRSFPDVASTLAYLRELAG